MRAIKVKFRNGNFIDCETGQWIMPSIGAEYILIGEEESFNSKDILSEVEAPRNQDSMAAYIKEKYGNAYVKIMDAGNYLLFQLGISKRVNTRESDQYIFSCILLEDLYLYHTTGNQNSKLA